MLKGAAACMETGISEQHAKVFQDVANTAKSIVACRAVGKYATGLIKEGYSSKGFHNKAKSCNWGPMAGFVLADPRFTKDKDEQGQLDKLMEAYQAGSIQVPLYISEARRTWLQTERLFELIEGGEVVQKIRAHKDDLSINFELHRDLTQGLTYGMWIVLYSIADRDRDRERVKAAPKKSEQPAIRSLGAAGPPSDRAQPKTGSLRRPSERPVREENPVFVPTVREDYLVPVMAVRDAHCTVPANDYRSATTGDYDLFAVWPSNEESLVLHMDKRMIETPELEKQIRAASADKHTFKTPKLGEPIFPGRSRSYEHQHQGNLTQRISEVKNLLNSGFMREGYTGGNMVHHSDEGGRPFVKSVDLPVFAVVPNETQPYCLETVEDMRAFIRQRDDYVFMLNKGWRAELGFDRPNHF